MLDFPAVLADELHMNVLDLEYSDDHYHCKLVLVVPEVSDLDRPEHFCGYASPSKRNIVVAEITAVVVAVVA